MVYLLAMGHMSMEKASFCGIKRRVGEGREDYFNLINPQAKVILKSAMILEWTFYLNIKYTSGYFN